MPPLDFPCTQKQTHKTCSAWGRLSQGSFSRPACCGNIPEWKSARQIQTRFSLPSQILKAMSLKSFQWIKFTKQGQQRTNEGRSGANHTKTKPVSDRQTSPPTDIEAYKVAARATKSLACGFKYQPHGTVQHADIQHGLAGH